MLKFSSGMTASVPYTSTVKTLGPWSGTLTPLYDFFVQGGAGLLPDSVVFDYTSPPLAISGPKGSIGTVYLLVYACFAGTTGTAIAQPSRMSLSFSGAEWLNYPFGIDSTNLSESSNPFNATKFTFGPAIRYKVAYKVTSDYGATVTYTYRMTFNHSILWTSCGTKIQQLQDAVGDIIKWINPAQWDTGQVVQM